MREYELHSYKNEWVMANIYRVVDTISHKVTNTGNVERRAILRVGKYLAINQSNKNHKRYILRLIHREVIDALKRNRREYAEHLEDLTTSDDEGQAIEYEPEDVLANVESDVMLKETITLLAKDDRRKKMILSAWADGYTDDTEISHILADVLTGKASGHLSYIKRFRNVCRTELTAQAI